MLNSIIGHGVQAALLAVAVNRVLVGISADSNADHPFEDTSPHYIAKQLSRLFSWDELEKFFTMTFCVLDVDTRECRFTCAGHPGPLVVRRSGQASCHDVPGFPIGLSFEDDYEENSLILQPGDRIYLYSDGVIEAQNAVRDQFGCENLMHKLQNACRQPLRTSVEAVLSEVEQFQDPESPRDDISLLGLEISS